MHSAHSPHLFACLPFVELAHESSIQMGPIIFWPASKFEHFISPDFHSDFQSYLHSISQVKARTTEELHPFVHTVHLAPQGTTCISIEKDIPLEQREFLLIDSLYLLYFACTFRNLYYSNEVPSFNAFRKMIPASMDFIRDRTNWESLYIEEADREETVCIHLFDQEICEGLGKMLTAIYSPQASVPLHTIDSYKRLIRATRYFVDRFFQRFINLFEKGLSFSEEIFEPEDIIFLATSFEALYDINDHHVTADFKHKLRSILHLKYSRPVELFWKWVDDFYEVKRRIVHGESSTEPTFRLNPNFEVSHILIGIKLFIYSVYYALFKHRLLTSKSFDTYTLPDFRWIHPEEVLLFFWTESSLLRKLSVFMTQAVENRAPQDELYADIHLLANTFVAMQERYYQRTPPAGIKFIPTPHQEVKGYIETILQSLELAEQREEIRELLLKVLPKNFRSYLLKLKG